VYFEHRSIVQMKLDSIARNLHGSSKCGIGGGTGTALTASRRKIRKRFSADENTGFPVNTGQVSSLQYVSKS
jgi:hypothetical protein